MVTFKGYILFIYTIMPILIKELEGTVYMDWAVYMCSYSLHCILLPQFVMPSGNICMYMYIRTYMTCTCPLYKI